jgi:organic hydroperoxide reductase OsmC/OhrA
MRGPGCLGDTRLMAVKSKEFRFPVAVDWSHDRTVVARIPGKPELEIATPPEFFPDADPAVWSPEDAFATAAASCLAVTILGIAAREQLPIETLRVEADGIAGRRPDGRFGFVRLEQRVEVVVDAADEQRVLALVERAEAGCLVAVSLDVDVKTTVDVRVAAPR